MDMHPALIWLGIGILLGIFEVLGASGFLIGAAVAAIAMALVTWALPEISLIAQSVFYAVGATIATYVYFRFFRTTDPNKDVDLHDKVGGMVGQQFALDETLTAHMPSKMFIGDTMWTVRSSYDLAEGTMVRIVGGTAQTVEVEAVSAEGNKASDA